MQPGSIVRFRKRDWILLPSPDLDVLRLRPLTGTTDDEIAVHRWLSTLLGYSFSEERVRPSIFPLPHPKHIADTQSVRLFWNAARLLLREGATPFRSLGRISIRPRTYQLVPLMMALRLNPVRLLIADDVGVGKTIEAGLIARELWDRGEIRRLAVLCPPYLTDQWQKELAEKFNLDPVVIGSGTIGYLERRKPSDRTIYEYYPVQVISIDFIKRERNRYLFLRQAPKCIIVDEAHGVAPSSVQSRHLRYELMRALAKDPTRHLILLTATPHSGIAEAFRRLLGLLDPRFETWDTAHLSEEQYTVLACHFVQRTRKDIEEQWKEASSFPTRDTREETYRLSPAYWELFKKTYAFCNEIVRSGEQLAEHRRRMRYWSALVLLRCVMSSPRAAQVALERRRRGEVPVDLAEEADYWTYAYEPSEEPSSDEVPTVLLDQTESGLNTSEQQRLRTLERLARRLSEEDDTKLERAIALVRKLLRDGFHPIVWCQYVATAEYVAEKLQQALTTEFPDLRVMAITGRMGEEERRLRVSELMTEPRRVLVATDCLSEGINLQEGFDAVLHYDLPWNPNRLEQREGRVDRYGQQRPVVRAILLYGEDNPVDGAVIRVLLRKAREIRRTLGTHVPVPENDEKVIQALVNDLFLRVHDRPGQLSLDFSQDLIQSLHRQWELTARREQETRTRFAHRTLNPEEVQRELEAADQVLGDPNAVREFVLAAAQRLNLPLRPDGRHPDVWQIPTAEEALAHLPDAIRYALPTPRKGGWSITFTSPMPEGATYLGRNHPFVTALAQYLFEQALEGHPNAAVTRCGAVRTRVVNRLTTLVLLRVRYRLEQPNRPPLLAEEVLISGRIGFDGPWLSHDEALRLLTAAEPDDNMPEAEKRELVGLALEDLQPLVAGEQSGDENGLWQVVQARARKLEEAHRRIRQHLGETAPGLQMHPHWPPDVLGVLVLQPLVGG